MLDVPRIRWELHAGGDGRGATEPEPLGLQRLRHDVRQPLSAVLLLVATLRSDTELSPAVRERLQQIEDEAEWMAEMLAASEDRPCTAEVVDVAAVVRGPVAAVSAVAPCRLRFRQLADVRVVVDPVPLRRSVRNLVDNSVRAAGPGGVVNVTVRRTAAEAVLEVADSGPGFGRVPQQQGLGLLTVRRFVAEAAGTLTVGTSRLGGARVMMRLPLAAADLCADHGDSA